jgi:hypothetical protein
MVCIAFDWFNSRAVFPILQSYADSGHRSARRRIISALQHNVRYYGIVIGIFTLGFLYLLITIKIGSFADLEALLIALANTYGLLLAIFCMGHGLVNTPRRIWQTSNLDAEIIEIERSATNIWETKQEAEDESATITGEIATWERTCEGRDDPIANWIRELALKNPDTGNETISLQGRTLTEDYVSSLNRKARIAQNQLLKAQTNWAKVLKRAGYLYDLKSASGTSGTVIEWKSSTPGWLSRLIPKSAQYFWFLHILPWLARIVSVAVRLVSISIVWSEIVHNWTHPLLSLVGIVIRSTGRKWFLAEVSYPLNCSYFRFFQVQFFYTWHTRHIQHLCASRF